MIAVISDVHANRHALEAVLKDMGASAKVWCLGDIIGYAAEPKACLDLVRSRAEKVVMGNHEIGALYSQGNPLWAIQEVPWHIRAAWSLAMSQLSIADRDWVADLPRMVNGELAGRPTILVHGSPSEPLNEYLEADYVIRATLAILTPGTLLFAGHTHVPGVWDVNGELVAGPWSGDEFILAPGHSYLINPGSVGQPRNGIPMACYAQLEPDDTSGAVSVTFPLVDYDMLEAALAIENAELPYANAIRLLP